MHYITQALHELMDPLILVCHQFSSPSISTEHGVNQGMSLSWWPYLPKQPWKLSIHHFALDQCPFATVLLRSTESLCHRDMILVPQAYVWRPGSSTVLQKAQRLSVPVIKVKCANFTEVALLIVFYYKTNIQKLHASKHQEDSNITSIRFVLVPIHWH